MSTPEIEIVELKPFESNTLKGFVTLRIVEMDLIVSDITLHEQNGKRWIGLPGKVQLDRDRKVVVGTNGKPAYTPVLRFASSAAGNQFRDAVLAALDKRGSRAA